MHKRGINAHKLKLYNRNSKGKFQETEIHIYGQ